MEDSHENWKLLNINQFCLLVDSRENKNPKTVRVGGIVAKRNRAEK